ncbi:MAG: PQQ-like beta-propeller repeat protein, partial [Acidobacteriaceae bacterium]|nr:PQQ-like beta-propeller repeat protein [Acidobacteriaceae bacterium]
MPQNGSPQIFGFDELTVWRTALPDVQVAALPPANNRPNPLVAADKVFVSIFSPGSVCALDLGTGRIVWRRELPKFAGASVYFNAGRLFAKCPHTLYALSPDSGEILWSFSPCGEQGEWIYSSPAVHQGSLYIGDRRGYLHCLDAESGRARWKQRTNTAANASVNSTPILHDGLVIVPTNASLVVAYEWQTGKPAWHQPVDGPSVFGPLLHKELLVVVAVESVYFLDPSTGSTRQHFQWKGDKIAFAESTPHNVLVGLHGTGPARGSSQVILLNESGVYGNTKLSGFCLHSRYSNETRTVYVSHLQGVDLCVPESMAVICRLATSGGGAGIGLVDVHSRR